MPTIEFLNVAFVGIVWLMIGIALAQHMERWPQAVLIVLFWPFVVMARIFVGILKC